VIVHDFNVIGSVGSPDEADTPLVVDANAVLTGAFPFQSFKFIAGRYPKVVRVARGVYEFQLTARDPFDPGKPLGELPLKQPLRGAAPERSDHG
jgi:hypothetical protein